MCFGKYLSHPQLIFRLLVSSLCAIFFLTFTCLPSMDGCKLAASEKDVSRNAYRICTVQSFEGLWQFNQPNEAR